MHGGERQQTILKELHRILLQFAQRMQSDRVNRRKRILDAMVELVDQKLQAVAVAFLFGDVGVRAEPADDGAVLAQRFDARQKWPIEPVAPLSGKIIWKNSPCWIACVQRSSILGSTSG